MAFASRSVRPQDATVSARIALLTTAASLVIGCGGGGAGNAVNDPSSLEDVSIMAPVPARFPSQTELARLEAAPAPVTPVPDVVLVDQWRMDAASESAELGPWQKLLRDSAPSNVQPDVTLDCAAKEIARIVLDKKGLPDERSRAYVAARCGSTLPSLGAGYASGTADPRVPESTLLEQARSMLRQQLGQLGNAHLAVGIGFARQGNTYAYALVSGVPEATLAPTTRRLDTSEVTIRGELRGQAQSVSALVNHGRRGVAECTPDGSISGSNFRFRCPVDPADQSTWVQVLVQRPGALLRYSVAQLLVFRDEEASRTYAPLPSAPNAAVAPSPAPTPVAANAFPDVTPASPTTPPSSASNADFATVVTERLNAARAELRFTPVELASEQSAQNAKLAQHFLGAGQTGDVQTVNLAAMGMLAGYSVKKPIQNGGIFGLRLSSSTDPVTWIDYALEQPLGRSVLLDPRMGTIAVGALPTSQTNAAAAVVTAYQIFQDARPEQLAGEVLHAFNQARAQLGAAPSAVWNDQGTLAQHAASIPLHSRSTETTLRTVMQNYANARGRSSFAFVIETNQLSGIQFPEQLLRAPNAEIGVGVSRRTVEGAPWGTYVVLVVFSQGEGQMTASADVGPRSL